MMGRPPTRPITEADLTPQISRVLKNMVKKGEGKTVFGYDDYPKPFDPEILTASEIAAGSSEARKKRYEEGFSMRGFSNIMRDMTDPTFAASTILGRFSTEKDEKNNTIIVDDYNFSNVQKGDSSMYSRIRSYLKPKHGSIPVRINLGKLD